MLTARALSVHVRGRAILRDVALSARPGEVLAVLGPNGAGKTTLLEAMSGLGIATGTVAWKESDHEARTLRSFRDRARVFALMPDEATLPEELSVRAVLDGGADEALVKKLGLAPLLERHAGALSRGEAKRVWLSLTLAQDRPVLLLDEPFGAFDPLQLDDVLDVVREKARAGATVIVTIHQLSTAERIADRILLLKEGKAVAEGSIADLRERAKLDDDATLETVFRALLSQRADAPA